MYKIAVLASTKGTDLQAIIDELKAGNMPGIELSLVISNKKNAYALKRAKEQGFKAKYISPQNLTRQEYDQRLVQTLKEHKIDLIVLIGYMRILSPQFVQQFKNRIINVHPALLPKYGGQEFYGSNVHQAVLESGDTETGMTIHYVEEGVDTGKIILQKTCPVEPDDTVETLKQKVQELEKKYYPQVIRELASKHKS